MNKFDESVYQDEKISTVLKMLKNGYSQDEIVQFYGNKNWKSIDMYFRRRGFRWKNDTYIPFDENAEENRKKRLESVQTELSKPAKIIRSLQKENADILEIATKNGFDSMEELGQYMKNKGYKWDSESENYIEFEEEIAQDDELSEPKVNIENLNGYEEFLQYLLKHKQQLQELLESESKRLPSFIIKGDNINKTLTMSSGIAALISDYSSEHSMTQKAVVETALIEFFMKYDFSKEVNRILVS